VYYPRIYRVDRRSHFRHVLNFLRSGTVLTLPTDETSKEELAVEADYYGLDGLVRAIRMPKVDVTEFLPESVLKQRRDEKELRDAFSGGGRAGGGTDDAATSSSVVLFRGLIPLFCPDDGIIRGDEPLLYDPESEIRTGKNLADCIFMESIRKKKVPSDDAETATKNPTPPVTVKNLAQFRTNFNREFPNVLHRLSGVLSEERIVIAGGAVLRALTSSDGIRTTDWWEGESSDIDMFLYCSNQEEANRIARRVFYSLAVDNERWVVVRSRGVINIHRMDEGRGGRVETKVQIVLRLYDSPAEVLVGFDVDCCCCAYDGSNVWASPRCVSALKSGVNVLNPLHAWPNKPSYELRLAKYAHRGFGVSVPGIDKSRVDFDLIHQSDLKDLKGMARFLKVVSEMESAPIYSRRIWVGRPQGDQLIERPRTAREVDPLRGEWINSMSEDDRLIMALDVGYDEANTASNEVVVPTVYVEEAEFFDVPGAALWWYYDNFPFSSESRDQAWEEILDAGEDSPAAERVPRRLLDAWDTDNRSREYLNGKMDPFDLDNLYYSKAYKDESTNVTKNIK